MFDLTYPLSEIIKGKEGRFRVRTYVRVDPRFKEVNEDQSFIFLGNQ